MNSEKRVSYPASIAGKFCCRRARRLLHRLRHRHFMVRRFMLFSNISWALVFLRAVIACPAPSDVPFLQILVISSSPQQYYYSLVVYEFLNKLPSAIPEARHCSLTQPLVPHLRSIDSTWDRIAAICKIWDVLETSSIRRWKNFPQEMICLAYGPRWTSATSDRCFIFTIVCFHTCRDFSVNGSVSLELDVLLYEDQLTG